MEGVRSSMAEPLAIAALILSLLNSVILVLLLRDVATQRFSSTHEGLPLGAALPDFVAREHEGREVRAADAAGRVMVFVASDCRPCHTLLNEVAAWRDRPPLLLTLAGDSASANTEVLLERARAIAATVILDPHRELFRTLRVPGTPFAYAIDHSNRVRARGAPTVAKLRDFALVVTR